MPECFFPTASDFGYMMAAEAKETDLGYQVILTRLSNKTLYGGDIDNVTLDVEFLTNTRLRFKVSRTVAIKLRGSICII